jgi:archaeal cell division control protein 6
VSGKNKRLQRGVSALLETTEISNAKPAMTFASVLKNPIYARREILYDQTPPSGFVHRVDQKNELVMELAPILMGSAVSCVFVYGNPGTGKTGLMLELMDELETESQNQDVGLKTVYVNCSENRTETVILLEVLSQLNPTQSYPKMGWNRAKALSEFKKVLENEEHVLLILDEVDYVLRESGDDIIYRLSRINSKAKKNAKQARVSTVLISNDVRVSDYIKPRTQSTLGRVKIVFPPYNHLQLYDILRQRSKVAFKPGVTGNPILKKIAEIEASRYGDARKALELLDSCAKIAIAKKRNKLTLDLVNEADAHLEKDQTFELITSLTRQQKLVYLSILKYEKDMMAGTDVFKMYKETCKSYNTKPLSERRVRSFVVNIKDLGLINSEVGWVPDLKKKARKIEVTLDKAVRNKAVKLLRDSI